MNDTIFTRFREASLKVQALVIGTAFFAIYALYLHFIQRLALADTAQESIFAAAVFVVTYYVTSMLMLRKKARREAVSAVKVKGKRSK